MRYALAALIFFSAFPAAGFQADITLGSSLTVAPGDSVPLPILLGNAAPPGGVTVTLSSSDTSKVTVSPANIYIPGGFTAPYSMPRANGIGFGSATITASAFGLVGSSLTVKVSAVLFPPGNQSIQRGTTLNVMFSLTWPVQTAETLTVTSDNSGIASVPATATIPAGSATAIVPITGVAVGNTVIHVGAPPDIPVSSVNVSVFSAGAITLSPVSLTLGQSLPFPVALGTPAPSGGVVVLLASSDPATVAIAPSSVFIPAGQTTPSAQPEVGGINIGAATITASAPGYVTVGQQVPVTATITMSPKTLQIPVVGGTQVLAMILSAAAPSVGVPITPDRAANGFVNGLTVQLSSSDSRVATVQPTVQFYPDGSSITTVVVVVTGTGAGTAVIHAGAPPFIPDVTATVIVGPSGTGPASLKPTGGTPQTAQVNTPFGLPLSVLALDSASNPVAGVLVTFVGPASGPGATFNGAVNTAVTDTSGVAKSQTLTANGVAGAYQVSATAAGVTSPATFALTNVAAASGTITLPGNLTIGPNQTLPFPISLTVPAPAVGLTVTLVSSDPTKAMITPATVTIPGGATMPLSQPTISGINFGSATIGASASGYASGSQLVQIGAALSFSPASLTINGSGTQNVSLNLSTPAPAAGVSVSLSSNNPAVATVPPSITFPANSTTVGIPVNGVGPGFATITATAGVPNVPNASAGVTVTAGSNITIAAGITVGPGESVPLPVFLTSPANGAGTTVTLTSSDISKVTVNPTNIYIPGGSTAPFAQPQVTGVNLGSADITASAYGLTGTTQTVRVVGKLFGPPVQTIARGSTANLMFALPWPTLVPITLSVTSDNSAVASAPTTVIIPANGTTAIVPVQGNAAGTTVIHVGALPDIAESTVNITVQSPGTITMASGVLVPLGQSATLPLTLGTPAPFGGLVVTLTSSDPSTVSISPSTLFFAPGAVTAASPAVVTGNNVGQANITASAPGYLSQTQAVDVTATITISPATLVVPVGGVRLLALTLSAAAPSVNTPITPDRGANGFVNGLTVQLSSSNPSVATLQPTVQFYPDGSSVTTVVIAVTGVGPGTAVVHAAAPPFIPDAVATVIVQ